MVACARRRAAGIQRLDLAGLLHEHQREQISAGPAGFGFDHGHDERRRQRRIDGVAAVLQDSSRP